MRNKDLLTAFLKGEESGKASNLVIKGNRLINYETCIAYRKGVSNIILNGNYYSSTTKVHQNFLRREANTCYEAETEAEFNDMIRLENREVL